MSDEFTGDKSFIVTDESQVEELSVVHGFRLVKGEDGEEDSIDIQVVYDGEHVTFRDADGELSTVGTLCYLDYVVSVCIKEYLNDGENMELQSEADVGHILAHMIQYLHSQMHMIHMQRHLQEMREQGGVGSLLAALAGGGATPVGAFVLGPNGLQEVDLSEALGQGEAVAGAEMDDSVEVQEQDDEPDEEIIIGEIPRRPRS